MEIIAQLPNLASPTTIDWNNISQVVVIALALVYISRAFLSFVKNTGEKDKREDGILKQMIDLATSYKSESAEARDAYKAEAAATRMVVQESNDTLRGLTEATNIQTGEIRKLPTAIEMLRFDFKNYQTINADEIEGFGQKLEALRGEMVTFRGEIQQDVDVILKSLNTTNHFVQQAVSEHEQIIKRFDENKVILAKLDQIISLLPPPPDNISTVDTDADDAPKEDVA